VPFEATVLLADAAQAVDNKLSMLGGGWSITGPEPIPYAIALMLKVPWDEANRKHVLRLELLDSDGQALLQGPAENPQPIVIETGFEVGRPPGLKPGMPIDLALAINVRPLPLPPGGRFEWRLSIDGHTEAHWHAAFSTRRA
jgi:hypothetical protein